MGGVIEQGRSALHGIRRVKSVAVFLVIDTEILEDVERFLLHDELVEHHRSAPHSAAGGEFAVEKCHTKSGLCHVVGCRYARRTARSEERRVGKECRSRWSP